MFCQNNVPTLTTNNLQNNPLGELLNNANIAYCNFKNDYNQMAIWDDARNKAIASMKGAYTKQEMDAWKTVLKSKNPCDLWGKINWSGEVDSFRPEDDMPPVKSLAEQFMSKSCLADGDEKLDHFIAKTGVYVHELDKPIDHNEISDALKKLKTSKSTFDGWVPQMLTSILGLILPILGFIFNVMFMQGIFSKKWIITLINAVFKNKGERSDPKKYRPISLVQLLSKLFDFILLKRFKEWFKPSDEQSAYQSGRSCADNIFILRCLISHAKKSKEKLFLLSVDFDGAFDRVSRSKMLRKLILFGAGATYVACLAAVYRRTEYIIFGDAENAQYETYAGIKQGSPMSPMLFLFYIDDIFQYFVGVFTTECLFETLHILMHADDAVILASTRSIAAQKLKHLVSYCRINSMKLEPSKSHFIVVNGTAEDMVNFNLSGVTISYKDYLSLLGSHLSSSGNLMDDLTLHMRERFKVTHKFFNFIKTNRYAPLCVKLKVLKACVMSNLLYNCETFGYSVPPDLEKLYFKLIKAALGVRNNIPNELMLIELGLLPLKALIYSRQLTFFQNFRNNLQLNSSRDTVFRILSDSHPKYLLHYLQLEQKYANSNEIYFDFITQMKRKICDNAAKEDRYKFQIYMEFNPLLEPFKNINDCRYITETIIKFRLGNHFLPIETGRWTRRPREERVCETCDVLGDEKHMLFECNEIDRTNLNIQVPQSYTNFWYEDATYELFSRIVNQGRYL